jgi:hypothetical protein
MSIELKVNTITSSLRKIQRKMSKLPAEAHKEFVKNTPVKTGNARRKTKLQDNKIKAQYPYAEVLDKGRHMTSRGMRGSDQAPEGMTKPTEEFIEKRIKQILKDK